MIVDDSSSFRQLLRTVLAPISSELIECNKGSEAVELYGSGPTDWVVMDVQMDGLDGLSATRTLKAQHPEARVIIVTQHDDDGLREESRKAGATAYLLKDDLLALRRFIETH